MYGPHDPFKDYRTSEWCDNPGTEVQISRIRKMHLLKLRKAREAGILTTLSRLHQLRLQEMEDTILRGSIFCARQLLKETLE